MSHADLSADAWRELTDEAAERLARTVARENDLELVEVRRHDYRGRPGRVAFFERAGIRLALVPGGRVELGYDGARFVPAGHQAESYAESVEEFGLPAMGEFVDGMTSPERMVELPATLVGVAALEPCERPLPADDPRVLELVAGTTVRPGGGVTHHWPAGGGLKVEFGAGGEVRAWLLEQVSYDAAVRAAGERGLRLSTPDEWEYACGAGARTLFRWGDDSLEDGYPYDHRAGPHHEPNAWGLRIGEDPYRHEWTGEPGVVCGGDGGGATCGGQGFFLGWLTLATAFRDPDFGDWLTSSDGYVDQLLIRPVVDLV